MTKQKDIEGKNPLVELPNSVNTLLVVRGWDRKIESLQQNPQVSGVLSGMGFDLHTLFSLLTDKFPSDMKVEEFRKAPDKKIEDIATQKLTINGRPLERLLVTAYPSIVNEPIEKMTQFEVGGEAILVTDGEAEITFASKVSLDQILQSDLVTEKVKKGDLILSTNVPNNWSKVVGDKFAFIYFVGNPIGPQRYGDVLKKSIPVVK
jgi:hypothetical protein